MGKKRKISEDGSGSDGESDGRESTPQAVVRLEDLEKDSVEVDGAMVMKTEATNGRTEEESVDDEENRTRFLKTYDQALKDVAQHLHLNAVNMDTDTIIAIMTDLFMCSRFDEMIQTTYKALEKKQHHLTMWLGKVTDDLNLAPLRLPKINEL